MGRVIIWAAKQREPVISLGGYSRETFGITLSAGTRFGTGGEGTEQITVGASEDGRYSHELLLANKHVKGSDVSE